LHALHPLHVGRDVREFSDHVVDAELAAQRL